MVEAQILEDSGRQKCRLQFRLMRLFQLVFIVAAASSLFATFKWPLAILVLSGVNAVASVYYVRVGKTRIAVLAFTTSVLLLATLFFTDWGLSSPRPVVVVAWPFLAAACVVELCAIVNWLFSGG